jgi:phosphoglycolate phosphatase
MTVKVIIFDFDGTIADTLDAVVSITNRLAGEFGYKQTSQEDLAILRNLNSRQIIKQSGVPIFKIPFLIRKLLLELNNEIQILSAFPGIKEALIELKNQGNSLGIITSNSKENVTAFLNKNGLQELFDFIYSGATIFGKSQVIKRVLKSENLNSEEVIYVGDETRDIEAAKTTHIKAIAVSWGFNSTEVLAKHNPDFLIHQPHELIDVIGSLQQRLTT